MADRITGIKALHEISLTRKAANGSCTKVLRNNLEGGTAQIIHQNPGQTDPEVTEESEMDAKIIKSLAGLQARTGTTGALYVSQLEDDKLKSFFEQDPAAQDAEVKTWDDAEKAKAAEAEAAEKAKSAGDPEVAELRETVKSLQAENLAEKEKNRDAELKNVAKSEYAGVPKAYDILKSIEGLTEAQRQPTLDLLKSQQEMSKNLAKSFGDDEAGEGTATAQYTALVDTVAKEKSITKSAAMVEIANDPNHRELVKNYRAELAG